LLYKSRVLKNIESDIFKMPHITEEPEPVVTESEPAEVEKVDIEAIKQKAHEDGFASGEKAGFTAGEQKAAVLIESLEKIIKEFTAFKGHLIKELEPQVVDLASVIARKIIIEEISLNPEVIVTMVKEALNRLQRTGLITIKVNPAIYDLLKDNKPALTEIREGVVIDVDPHLPVTGPLVIGEAEEIVTDIESLLTNIIEKMKDTAQQQTNNEETDTEETGTSQKDADN
jgi:flagellar assembly protein FliH